MGTLFVLVSPCFRENVVVTCKIGSFCVVLIIYFRKTWVFSFLEIKFQNDAHLKKGLFLTFFSHFLVTREKLQNSFSTYLTHIHVFCSQLLTLLTFLPYPSNFEKKNTNLSGMGSLWYESWCWFLFAPFWNNQWITKFKLECLLLTLMPNL